MSQSQPQSQPLFEVLDTLWQRPVTTLVVGDVMLDRYTQGVVHRVSPEAPVPVVVCEKQWAGPGGAGNAAANIACLGDRVLLVGAVGADDEADLLKDCLHDLRIDPQGLVTMPRPTSTKHRIVASGQQIVRVDTEQPGPLDDDTTARLTAAYLNLLPEADVVLVSDYAKGVCAGKLCTDLVAAAVERGLPVVVDPKGSDFTRYRRATVVTPNLSEARQGAGSDADTVDELGRRLVAQTEGHILVTRGPEGMSLYSPDDAATGEPGALPLHLPARAQRVYDVTGAGDTVAAVLSSGLGHRLPLPGACWVANEAAAIAVSRHGTVSVGLEELLTACHAAVGQVDAPPGS
jgi:rfaE bifunctional protein kinase chain/domain